MLRNGVPLTLFQQQIAGTVRVLANWPLSGAGRYELALHIPGRQVEREQWTVEPAKISQTSFRKLISELEERLPISIALGLKRLGAASGLDFIQPVEKTGLAEEINRLRTAIHTSPDGPGLASILTAASRDPYQVLTDNELWVRSDFARRVSPNGFIRAMAQPSNVNDAGLPERLPDERVVPTVDVYENQLLKAFHDQVFQRLSRLLTVLETGGHTEYLHESVQMRRTLHAARRQANFLDHVSTLGRPPSTMTMVLMRRIPYREALDGYLRFRRRAAVRLGDPALRTPLEELPTLYESWGSLQVISVVLGLAAELSFEVEREELLQHDPGGLLVRLLPSGRAAVQLRRDRDECRLRVIPQRTYSSSSTGLRSLSYQQIPDIAVEIERPGEKPEVYIFDPKYKLDSEIVAAEDSDGKPKKVDIDKMHAYRDAIRNEIGERVVQFAAIVYPGPPKSYGPGLAALPGKPGSPEDLLTSIREVLREPMSQR